MIAALIPIRNVQAVEHNVRDLGTDITEQRPVICSGLDRNAEYAIRRTRRDRSRAGIQKRRIG